MRWDIVDAIMTDVPKVWLDLRSSLSSTSHRVLLFSHTTCVSHIPALHYLSFRIADYESVSIRYKRTFLWTNPMFYPWVQATFVKVRLPLLLSVAGPLDPKEPWDPNKLNKDTKTNGSGAMGWVIGVVMKVSRRSRSA